VPDTRLLKDRLDRLTSSFGPGFLETDPLGIVHRYGAPEDRETAGFIAAMLAYGGAAQIRRSVEAALEPLGQSPAKAAASLSAGDLLGLYESFRHRGTPGSELAFLIHTRGGIIERHGSLGAFVRVLDDPAEPNIGGLLTRLAEYFRACHDPAAFPCGSRTAPSYLVPSPAHGSACKRPAMFMRWMVRGPDGVDFGLWRFIDPARLIISLDRHIARMGLRLGLTRRKQTDWRTALEITDSLRRLDPADPVRYDFALVRPGILGLCAKPDAAGCAECILSDVCGELP